MKEIKMSRLATMVLAILLVTTLISSTAFAAGSPVADDPTVVTVKNSDGVPINATVVKLSGTSLQNAETQLTKSLPANSNIIGIYNITPENGYEGAGTVAIPYSGTGKPVIYHFDEYNAQWSKLSTNVIANKATANTPNFSLFAVVEEGSGSATPTTPTAPSKNGEYTVTDATGKVMGGNIVTPITNNDLITESKKMMGLTSGQELLGLYSFNPQGGVTPYTLQLYIGDVNSASMYIFSGNAWSKIASTYTNNIITAILKSADSFAVVAEKTTTADVILPAGTKYYMTVDGQPGTPGQELTLTYATQVSMGKTYPTGYTEITIGGVKYLIKGAGAVTPVDPSQPSQGTTNSGGAGTTSPTSPKTGDDSVDFGAMIAVMVFSLAGAIFAGRKAVLQ